MSTMTAKDLTKEFPRSPYDELEGFPWLPRLIDKVRALQAGTLGEYTPFPCGGDQNFLKTFGIDAEGLKAVIFSGASDAEIVQWAKQHATADQAQAAAGYRQQARSAIPAGTEMHGWLEGSKAELAQAKPGVDLSKITNWAQLICVEVGHPLL
jgi:hypothetical protein